jgi:hypothetical protein
MASERDGQQGVWIDEWADSLTVAAGTDGECILIMEDGPGLNLAYKLTPEAFAAIRDEMERGTWAWACEQTLAGKRVRRPVWQPGSFVGEDDDGDLGWLHKSPCEKDDCKFIVDTADLRATDWEVVPS